MTDRPTGRTEQQTDDGRTDRVMGNYVCSTVISMGQIYIYLNKRVWARKTCYIQVRMSWPEKRVICIGVKMTGSEKRVKSGLNDLARKKRYFGYKMFGPQKLVMSG